MKEKYQEKVVKVEKKSVNYLLFANLPHFFNTLLYDQKVGRPLVDGIIEFSLGQSD